MFFSHLIAERKIQEALRNGEFDDLPGKGEPLRLEDESGIPEELRLAYKILKNADCLPPELELKKEILNLGEMIQGIEDLNEKYRQMKRLNFMIMKLNLMRKVSPLFEEDQVYYEKVVERVAQKGKSTSK
jgi:hypothetical protein